MLLEEEEEEEEGEEEAGAIGLFREGRMLSRMMTTAGETMRRRVEVVPVVAEGRVERLGMPPLLQLLLEVLRACWQRWPHHSLPPFPVTPLAVCCKPWRSFAMRSDLPTPLLSFS